MVGAPVLAAAVVLLAVASTSTTKRSGSTAAAVPAITRDVSEVAAPAVAAPPPTAPARPALAGKPADELSSSELLDQAERKAVTRREQAEALRTKLATTPELAADKATRSELLELAADPLTSRIALASMARLKGPVGPDLLYEVWTGTPARTDATELARALVYSGDVRSGVSPALAVALELRAAETCDQNKAALPKAVADADRRSLHLLTKLLAKRGCGAKKNEDCFACLRDQQPQLDAAIAASKGRRAP
jgi:hypothetical protein